MSPRGRRPAGEDTRAAIVAAAAAEFATSGYAGSSLRAIARRAGVDPRLVHHYFEGKSALFAEVMHVPVNPAAVIAQVMSGPPEATGANLLRAFLTVWDSPQAQPALVALVRTGLSSEELVDQLRGFVERDLIGQVIRKHPATKGLPAKERRVRAGLIATQMLGLVLARYIVRMPGIVESTSEELVARLGPIVQGLLDPQFVTPGSSVRAGSARPTSRL